MPATGLTSTDCIVADVTVRDVMLLDGFYECVETYSKCCVNPDVKPNGFNAELYMNVEKAGMLKSEVLLEPDTNICCGFAAAIVSLNPHLGAVIASLDTVFVMPEFRRGGNAQRMLARLDERCKDAGAKGMYLTAPANSRLEKVYDRLYQRTNILYWKDYE